MVQTKQSDMRPPIEKYMSELKAYEKAEGICLSDEQETAILALAQHSLMIVTGYPGAGKTTTIKAMLHVVSKVEKLERENMLLLSPTGKAARRMEEATGYPASTIIKSPGYLALLGKADDEEEEQSPLSNIPAGEDNGTVLDCIRGSAKRGKSHSVPESLAYLC